MAKLLIIDDQVKMVRILQEYLQGVNSAFTKENTFYFEEGEDGKLEIRPVSKLDQKQESRLIRFRGKDEIAKKGMRIFLDKYTEEDVLVIIDLLLNSQDIVAPSVDKYFADEEFSYELYMELMRIKAGKDTSTSVIPDNLFFFIFSRSEIGCPLFAKILHKAYVEDENVPEKLNPAEWYQPEYISWCKNNLEAVGKDGIVQENPEIKDPLDLTVGYKRLIASLK